MRTLRCGAVCRGVFITTIELPALYPNSEVRFRGQLRQVSRVQFALR